MRFTYIPNANNPVDAQPQLSSEIQFFCLLFRRRPSTIQHHTSKYDFSVASRAGANTTIWQVRNTLYRLFCVQPRPHYMRCHSTAHFHLFRLTCTEKLRRKKKSVVSPLPFPTFQRWQDVSERTTQALVCATHTCEHPTHALYKIFTHLCLRFGTTTTGILVVSLTYKFWFENCVNFAMHFVLCISFSGAFNR